MNSNQNNKVLKVLSAARPESVDPILYDSFVHHLIFRSVYASLTSSYSAEGLKGDLAKSWSAKDGYKIWEFEIDTDRRFSNGDRITAEFVLQSLMRIAYLQKKANSQLGIFDDIVGIKNLSALSDPIEGMTVSGDVLKLKFTKPQEDLLLRLSFGVYGIVHPSDYDSRSGEWKNPKSIISSGLYQLDKMVTDETVLVLNKFLEGQFEENFEEIKFIHTQPSTLSDVDLIYGSSESLVVDDSFYFSSPIKSTIRYVVCGGWNIRGNVCEDRANRKYLRNLFYNFLEKKGLEVVRSFFPTSISGVKQFSREGSTEHHGDIWSNQRNITFLKMPPPKKSQSNSEKYSYVEGFNDFVTGLEGYSNIEVSTEKNESLVREEALYQYDLSMNFTGILIDNPKFDIRFMFLSSEGIRLPDDGGSIRSLLKLDNFDIQTINEMIWDQAIVWPVNHLSLGLWIQKSSQIDLSKMNLAIPPADFRYIFKK